MAHTLARMDGRQDQLSGFTHSLEVPDEGEVYLLEDEDDGLEDQDEGLYH